MKNAFIKAFNNNNIYAILESLIFQIRTPAANEEGAITIGSEKKIVEFDSWKNRDDKSTVGFGWDECSSSIFVPCKTTDKSGLATPRKKNPNPHGQSGAPSKPIGKNAKFSAVIKTEDGFDANENIDFFWDIDDDIQKG